MQLVAHRLDAQLRALEMMPDRIKAALPPNFRQRFEGMEVGRVAVCVGGRVNE